MYFRSSVLEVPKWSQVFANAFKSPEKSKKAYFGLFPFDWQVNWYDSFTKLRGNGRLLVAPILRTLILNRAPEETLDWANRVARWDFTRIIPCHFDNAIAATPQEFRQAFSFLEQHPAMEAALYPQSLPSEDLQLLQDIDRRLYQSRLVPPPKR
jgi:hypothetical protein